mmetsp:Transcript_4514/g.9192  ORF Transcript_4514/g.9192 Transcript_4514/m.9192 type:complete len:434 (+) Transcript_4514:92-1393(+)
MDASSGHLRLEDTRQNGDVCMSDRLVPSRGTCRPVGSLMLEDNENWAPQNEYQEVLSKNVLGRESLAGVKVLSYMHKPQRQEPNQNDLRVLYSCNREAAAKPKSPVARVVPQTPAKVLDAPGIVDDFYSHPVDWSSRNVIAVALSESVFLFDAASGRTESLMSLPAGNVTTIRWTDEGSHLSVGSSSGEIQLWDVATQRQLRSLRSHGGRVGALAWHGHQLSSGSADAEIHQHDVRIRDHLIERLSGAHADLVCGLDYSADGVLASGGNDNVVCIWDRAALRTCQHRFTEHQAAVKALRWCPWQRHVLATGGGTADRRLCLWNASSGRLLSSADTSSQVTGIVWGAGERELLTAHGYSRNQLTLWKYPSLVKSSELDGHEGRILGLAQSPDGSMVCSSSADETLRFWQVFSPQSHKKRSVDACGPSSMLRTIR